jgi:hypothetical protein
MGLSTGPVDCAIAAQGSGLNQTMQLAAPPAMTSSQHIYEIQSRKDERGVDWISDAASIPSFVVLKY